METASNQQITKSTFPFTQITAGKRPDSVAGKVAMAFKFLKRNGVGDGTRIRLLGLLLASLITDRLFSMRYGDEFHSSSYLFLQNLHFVPALGFQSGNIISAVSMATDGSGTELAGPVILIFANGKSYDTLRNLPAETIDLAHQSNSSCCNNSWYVVATLRSVNFESTSSRAGALTQ
jgi:hypothetical protein